MKMEASDKVAQATKKPHIKKGYYSGMLNQVKPRQDKEGNWIEGKFGRQIILLFTVHTEDQKPVMNPDQPSEQLVLATVLNSEYKDKDGSYRTAVTKNARISKVFEALGWTFTPDGFDTDEFIGKWVELNIDDYEVKDEDGTTYKASSIKDIKKLEGDSPSPSPLPIVKENKTATKQIKSTELSDDKKERIQKMTKMFEEGLLSQEGLDKAIEQIENEHN